MGRGSRPEGVTELHPGLGPGSLHGASMGLGRQGRAGVDSSSYMAAFWYTPSQALLKTRHWFVFMECGLEEHVIPSGNVGHKITNMRGHLIGKGIGKGSSSQVDGALGGHAKPTMYKQSMGGTLVLWHRECHLQQHSISHHCFVMSFIIILLTIFTLLRKTTIFTAFAFYP